MYTRFLIATQVIFLQCGSDLPFEKVLHPTSEKIIPAGSLRAAITIIPLVDQTGIVYAIIFLTIRCTCNLIQRSQLCSQPHALWTLFSGLEYLFNRLYDRIHCEAKMRVHVFIGR